MFKINKFILLTLLLSTFSGNVEPWDPIKIFDRADHIEVGIYVSCTFGMLSNIAIPNIQLNADENHYEIIFSLEQQPSVICSPVPPQYIDDIRHYFDLGELAPGTYTVDLKYVENDSLLPPVDGVKVISYDYLSFQVAHPIPSLGLFGLLVLVLFLLFISFSLIPNKTLIPYIQKILKINK